MDMRKNFFVAICSLLMLSLGVARADDGMWLPSLIGQRIGDMQAKGFKLGAELESLGLHVTYSLADKGWKPHSVIRPGDAQGQHQKRTDCHKEVFSHVHD